MIGSAILRKLRSKGYNNVITRTHHQLDLTDQARVKNFFKKARPEYVFLAAGKVGGISANLRYPAEFIYQNIMIQANLIDLSYRFGVKKLLFLASSCIYPKFCKQPMKENDLLTGSIEQTSEAFAIAKLAGIKMCREYNRQYGKNFISIIPSNIYGPNDHLTADAHVISALIKRFHEAGLSKKKIVRVWGTGKPKREFLYSDDLADACLFLMGHYDKSDVINVGSGTEISIRDLAEMISGICSYGGKIIYDRAKPDGNLRRFLDSGRVQKLGWRPKTGLRQGLKITYDWFRRHYNLKNER